MNVVKYVHNFHEFLFYMSILFFLSDGYRIKKTKDRRAGQAEPAKVIRSFVEPKTY